MTCFNCKEQISEKDIGIEKTFSFGRMIVGFFIICKKCYEKLTLEGILRLEKEYQKKI